MLPGSAGAPFALALSARSNVLQEFEGGPGQIAIHGVANLGGTPGMGIDGRKRSWVTSSTSIPASGRPFASTTRPVTVAADQRRIATSIVAPSTDTGISS